MAMQSKMLMLKTVLPALLALLAGCAGNHTGLGKPQAWGSNDPEDKRWVRQELYKQFAEWRAVPHRSGGLSKRGVDCSGFVYLTYLAKLGVKLPRNSAEQMQVGRAVAANELSAGDLVFFITGNSDRHVGIYLEDRKFLHVSLSKGVTISSLDDRYWLQRYIKAARVLG